MSVYICTKQECLEEEKILSGKNGAVLGILQNPLSKVSGWIS